MTYNVFSGTLSPTQSIYKVLKPKINLQNLANYVHRSQSGGAGCQGDDRRSETGSVATTQEPSTNILYLSVAVRRLTASLTTAVYI